MWASCGWTLVVVVLGQMLWVDLDTGCSCAGSNQDPQSPAVGGWTLVVVVLGQMLWVDLDTGGSGAGSNPKSSSCTQPA